jgi:transcriptional activator
VIGRAVYCAIGVLAIAASLVVAGEDRGGKVYRSSHERPAARTLPRASTNSGYVGSQACARCHRAIFDRYSRTGMGRSMSAVTPEFLKTVPGSASVFDQKLNRHFDVTVHDGILYQSEYETRSDGSDVFREIRKIDWIIGSGANGLGGIVSREDFLFEAPLSYYSKTHAWALSPGYEFGDYGFNRPILPACIACHSGFPLTTSGGNGKFLQPPFQELAIGCENCHGPGAAHVVEMVQGAGAPSNGPSSIVNPAKLASHLADNVCMSCHQIGDARVLQPGKNLRDFRPGAPLDDTLAILMVPPKRDAPPQSDLLQHYFSMTMSKCYRASGERLSCITCHDPHVEPAGESVSGYYRAKCFTCHTDKSCAVPLALRQRKNPPDDCVGCHMPKRDITVISHSALTNHRIVASPEERFPDEAFQLTTPQLKDLVHLDPPPGKENVAPPLLTLLQAYGQLMNEHPEYRARYHEIAQQLEGKNPNDPNVLEALADRRLGDDGADGKAAALGYLMRALQNGATAPEDFERVAILLVGAGRAQDAIGPLEQGIGVAPYDEELYRQLAAVYFKLNRNREALATLRRANSIFPADADIRKRLDDAEAAQPHN